MHIVYIEMKTETNTTQFIIFEIFINRVVRSVVFVLFRRVAADFSNIFPILNIVAVRIPPNVD